MCLAVPGKIISRNRGQHAVVSFDGLKKQVNVKLVPGARVGDWVTVHAGFAIGKLTKAEAKKTRELLSLIH